MRRLWCHFLAVGFLAFSLCGVSAFEPIAFFHNEIGWSKTSALGYSAEVISTSDGLPIGVYFGILDSYAVVIDESVGDREPLGPWPCTFEGVGWVLLDGMGYSARFVLGPDHSLVGISYRVWNNSLSHPLTLLKRPGSLPFYCEITREEMDEIPVRNPSPFIDWQRPQELVEWILPPRHKEEVFVPIRDLLPVGFHPQRGAKVAIGLLLNIVPKSAYQPTFSGTRLPEFLSIWARLTETGLSPGPQEMFKQALDRETMIEKKGRILPDEVEHVLPSKDKASGENQAEGKKAKKERNP